MYEKLLLLSGVVELESLDFTALTAKAFIEAGKSPLLLVDADPDQNLAEMLGVDLKAQGKATMAELIVDTFIQKGGTTVGIPPAQA